MNRLDLAVRLLSEDWAQLGDGASERARNAVVALTVAEDELEAREYLFQALVVTRTRDGALHSDQLLRALVERAIQTLSATGFSFPLKG